MPSPHAAARAVQIRQVIPLLFVCTCCLHFSAHCLADDSSVYRPQDPHRLLTSPPTFAPTLLSMSPSAERATPSTSPPATSASKTASDVMPPGTPFLDLSRPETTAASTAEPGVDRDALINFGLWMVVILCLCGLSVVGLKMLQRRGIIKAGSAGPSTGQARVIDSLSLGRNQFVQLIEIGGRQVLLASDTSGIREMVPLADEFDTSLIEATEHLEDAA